MIISGLLSKGIKGQLSKEETMKTPETQNEDGHNKSQIGRIV